MSEDTWDLVVIGTGGAAMAAGIEARSGGKQVLLIEHGPVGGTCLNIGCVPSKNLLAAAGQRHRAASNRAFPMVKTSSGSVDVPALMAQKQDLIDGLRQAKYLDVADAHGFPIRRGHARFVNGQTLQVDGEQVEGRAYVVATGAAPHVPDLPGLDRVEWLTSTTAMEQQSLPESMVVLGGGYVGLEQAQLWAHLGVAVTLVGRFAPHAEPEIADVLRGVFADDGIAVVEERGEAVEAADGGVLVRTASGLEVTGERLLLATGRFADTGDLGLEAAGVATDERGFVTVDDRQATSNARVFAAGDVSGAPQYVYAAARTGKAAVANAARRGRPRRLGRLARRHVHHPANRLRRPHRTPGAGGRARLRLPGPRGAGHPPGAGQPRYPRRPQARRGRQHGQGPGRARRA